MLASHGIPETMVNPGDDVSGLHQQLIAMAKVMPAIVWISDADGSVFHASDAFYDFVGHRDFDMPSGEWVAAIHPDDQPSAIDAWGRALVGGEVYSTEFRLRRHDGRFRWHLLSGQPVRDASGTIAAWYGAAIDVDQSRREYALVAHSERLLEALATREPLESVTESALTLLDELLGGEWTIDMSGAPVAHADHTSVPIADGRGGIAASFVTTLDLDGLDEFDRGIVSRAVSRMSIAIEQDRTDQELSSTASTLRLASRLTRMGAWSFDVGGDHMVWSDEICEIHGVAPGSSPTIEEAMRFYADEDRERIRDVVSTCARNGTPFDVEARIVDSNGQIVWVRAVGEADRHPSGRITAVRGALQDVSEWRAAQEAMRRTERRFAEVARATSDVVWEFDVTTGTFWRSEGLPDVFGATATTASRFSWHRVVHPDDIDRVLSGYRKAVEDKAGEWSTECRMRRKDDTWAEVRIGAFLVRENGALVRVVGNVVDVTAEHKFERQRLQGQRLEAIGQLTGGVAHDFNNLLTVIIGGAELLELEAPPQHREVAQMVRVAAERGADLTHRLLAFARRQPLEPGIVDVHQMLTGLDVMLRRTLGEDLDLEYVRAGGLWLALVDEAQLESAVLNLCLNARDAMPNGGRLTIETVNSSLDQEYAARHPGVEPGQYVMVAVSDTGIGMEPDVVAQAFEPFFTTKQKSSGTGLGLSMVYGFVKQSRGHVKIYSEPGEGTTVRLYLPRAVGDPTAPRTVSATSTRTGAETILVVEDDPLVRNNVVRQLTGLGYAVRSAENADRALELLSDDSHVDLLFTDVVMPGSMSGRGLADIVQQRWPSTRVLFTSGYTENAIVHHGRLDHGVQFLVKPYRLKDLADRVRAVLDGPVKPMV